MTGRGIDQILPHPVKPHLYEPYVNDAREYISIAENVNGPIPRKNDYSYIWGDALSLLDHEHPDTRLINLETSITHSENYWPDKGINYRMSPENIDCITSAGIDCCVLANNHVLDWGYDGLSDTLNNLDRATIKHAGAGRDRFESIMPAVIETISGSRLIVFALGKESSGIPDEWASSDNKPGVALFESDPDWYLKTIADYIKRNKRENDIILLSIHWGENWGYEIPRDQIELAHAAIDFCGVDCIHGHSSHHPKGIEIYKNKLIFYGCGDLINDYEGISGYEDFKSDLSLMYIVEFASKGNLRECKMFPMRIQRFSLKAAGESGCKWFEKNYRSSAKIRGTDVIVNDSRSLTLVL